jgi:hypothetical protein
MRVFFQNAPKNFTLVMRELGYHPDRQKKAGILSFSHRISGNDYPKFHVYIEKGNNYLTLHLDMKAPSYGGTSAHAGEYDSADNEWLKGESERLKDAFSRV